MTWQYGTCLEKTYWVVHAIDTGNCYSFSHLWGYSLKHFVVAGAVHKRILTTVLLLFYAS